MSFREIDNSADLCLPNGELNPAAVGFSRRPLHRTNLRGWGRNKRWEYWGIVTPTHVIGLTVSDLDYAQINQVYVLDRATKEGFSDDAVLFLRSKSTTLPDHPPPITAAVRSRSLDMSLRDTGEGAGAGTRIEVRSRHLRADLMVREGGDCLAVVVPWSKSRFQYTVKDLARSVGGAIWVNGQRVGVDPDLSYAVLDRGRGRWPYRKTWNWGAGSGIVDGRRLGLQVGGKWTDGTGSTENGLFVDGKLDYWPEELEWTYDLATPMRPWHVRGPRLDATLTPFHVRRSRTNLLLIGSDVTQVFGYWSGHAIDAAEGALPLDGLVGWAEEAANRW